MNFMGRTLLSFADNKKTYLVAGAIVVVGVAQGLGYHIPDWVLWVLGAGGLSAHRNAVAQVQEDVIDTKNTLQTLVDTVSITQEAKAQGVVK